MPKKFLTVNEVAKILGVTALTIRNWDKKGKLSAYRNPFNNYRVYKVEDVEKILKRIDNSKGAPMNIPIIKEEPKAKKIKVDML